MADNQKLIANLDAAVRDVLAYFDGAGRTTTAMVDKWQARDVLQHFIYFHDATAWGIQSAAFGGPPWPLPGDADIINQVCRRLHGHEDIEGLLTQLKQAHARLTRAARRSPDLDQPCFKRANGDTVTGRQRLEILAKHWNEHGDELKRRRRRSPQPGSSRSSANQLWALLNAGRASAISAIVTPATSATTIVRP